MTIEENPFDHILYEFSTYLQASLIRCDTQFITNFQVDSRLVHLRNLAYFFDKKKNCDIHASVYIEHPDSCLVESKHFGDIYHITNCAACHMSFERLKPDFKQKTLNCEKQAFRKLVPLIQQYLVLLDTDLKPEYEVLWNNGRIQAEAEAIKQTVGAKGAKVWNIRCLILDNSESYDD